MGDKTKGIDSIYLEDDNEYACGLLIEDDDYLHTSVTLSKINEMASKAAKLLNVDINEINLICSTYAC